MRAWVVKSSAWSPDRRTSRCPVLQKPVALPKGVEFKNADGQFTVKGRREPQPPQPQGADVSLDQGVLTMVPAGRTASRLPARSGP